MTRAQHRVKWWLACGLLVVLAGGCGLVTDLFDPDLAGQLGLDPATVKPQQGTVIVAFSNTTRYTAQFRAFWSRDAQNLARHSRNFNVEVPTGSVRNEVLECPVGLVSPGSLGDDYSYDATAVVVQGAGGAEGEVYAGPPLESGHGFVCGDVIEIRLSSVGTGENVTFNVSVRVIRGR